MALNKLTQMTDSGEPNNKIKTPTKKPSSAKLEQVKSNVTKIEGTNTPATYSNTSKVVTPSMVTAPSMNTSFTASDAYLKAMEQTNSLLEQLSSGRTSYTDQIKDLMNQIQNRDAFEYDADSDPLFQQALASAMSSGKTAMQDTIGQASALTGGYGSSYATSAGNQAYNAYIQDAYNNLPEYYQMAMEAYQMEGQEMYDQFAMLSEADAREYQKMYDSWSANFSNAQQMYQNEYSSWQDSVNYAMEQAQFNSQMAYNYAKLEQDQNQFEATQASKNASSSNDSSNLKEPSETQMAKALEAYNSGGMKALNQYINSLPSTVNRDLVAEYVGEFGTYDTAENPLPLMDRTWSVVDDGGWNMGWGIDRDAEVKDHYGNNAISLKDLYDQLTEEGMSSSEAKNWIVNLQKELGI